jgi:DNA-binding NarL/FixJ family response regulator
MAEAAVAAGRSLPHDEAIAEALATSPVEVVNQSAAGAFILSRREREVAALIARGSSNAQIASELVISRGTVATHVNHILAKLGLASRAQVAVWAAQHRLLEEPTL